MCHISLSQDQESFWGNDRSSSTRASTDRTSNLRLWLDRWALILGLHWSSVFLSVSIWYNIELASITADHSWGCLYHVRPWNISRLYYTTWSWLSVVMTTSELFGRLGNSLTLCRRSKSRLSLFELLMGSEAIKVGPSWRQIFLHLRYVWADLSSHK